LSSDKEWTLFVNQFDPIWELTGRPSKEGIYDVSIREVGRPETVLTKRLEMYVEGTAPGFLP